MRPSISGSATFIARSRGPRPRVPARQASSSPPENTTCRIGQSARSGSLPPDAATEKPVALRITAGGWAAKASAISAAASPSLRLWTKIGNGRSRRAASACDQRIDRRGVPGLHQRPVEDDRHDAAIAAPFRGDVGEARHGAARPIEPGAQQRRRLGPLPHLRPPPMRAPRRSAGNCRRCPGRLRRDSATAAGRRRAARSRARASSGSGLSSPGSRASGMPCVAAGLDEALDAVGPIGAAAEQPGDDQPGLRRPAPCRDRPRDCGRAA